ncbi:YrzI family small protein [Bacillus sp. SG-1]|nr:YrzI family small protein [Bacillus sp. SG-1]
MTLNILFMSITVKRRMRPVQEYHHDEMVTRHFEEHKLKQETMRMY